MQALWIELNSHKHGLVRYRIKVIRRFNVPIKTLVPKSRRRKPEQVSSLIVGRGVSEREIMSYMAEYFRRVGLWDKILWMKME